MNRKTVLVTGSSRGIGKAIAIKFAKKNYNVVINCSKSKESLEAVKKEIEGYNVTCLSFIGDVGEFENAKELFTQIKRQFGGIDVLVNNAGISYMGLFQDMEPDAWNKIISTNLTSVYNCCHFAIPEMVHEKKGKIINISSVWGITGASCEVAYAASKGAVNTLTKALAKELAPSGIQVNAVACGAIDTEMNYFLEDQDLIDLVNNIPAGRLGQAEEVADFVYQISTKHDYLTGQALVFDGGWI